MDELQIDKRARLRQEISKQQDELEQAILELRGVVETGIARFDIRQRIAADPLHWLAGGFVLGLMVGLRRR